MLTVMAKAKSKQKKRNQTNLSKVRKKGSTKKKTTTNVRKSGGKKKASRRKAAPRSRTSRAKTVPSPAAFTEIASEEVTASTPSPGEQETIGSTESTGVGKGEFTSTDSNSDTSSL
jgi:uncharacterized membrane protein